METRTHLGLAAAALVLIAVCAFILVARPFGDRASEPPAQAPTTPAPRAYTMGQYRQLSDGMSIRQAERVMGGGASVTTSETGGQTTDVYMYFNEDGSFVTASFVDDRMISKSVSGF